ncbi:MAG TPA: ribonuclease HII [Pseudonocardiaceae bacterium]|jgi:ribonuclease HII|nr:ribonuclease HII [Pseudonocardiaceae bacterium]
MPAVARSIRQALPRPPRAVVRRDGGIWTLQSVLHRQGLSPVAGVDEAGRGACAGPLVVAACVLRPADAAALDGLTDSKLLTAARREHYYDVIATRAVARSVVVIPPDEVDDLGVHVANLEGMRRAVSGLPVHPGYVLTDGFRVPGLTAPNMAVIGGDRAAACVAAASVLAKVTRDRIMGDLDERMPWYGFGEHKGYCTPEHNASLLAHGPSTQHRFGYVNVALAARRHGLLAPPRRTARARLWPVVRPAVVQNGVSPRAGEASTR